MPTADGAQHLSILRCRERPIQLLPVCAHITRHTVSGELRLYILKERAALNWGARLIDILRQVCVCMRGH